MRFALAFLAACCCGYGLSNAITIKATDANAEAGQPFTISRFFAEGEIANFARPRVNGAPVAVWQCDRKTTWPGGSLQHALISFRADIPKRETLTVDFVTDTAPSSGGGPLTEQQMLDFDGGGGPGSWDGEIEARAPFVTPGATALRAVNARTVLGAGNWRYWLSGPAVTQVIVEDRGYRSAADQTRYDFGWERAPAGSLAAPVAPGDSVLTVANAPGWNAPFTATIDGEDVYVCSAQGNTLNAGTLKACPSADGRGYGGTKPAVHAAGKPVYPNLWKDAGSIEHKSVHPIFVLTFYPGWKGVKIDFILENAWSTRAQDVAFALTLKTGRPLAAVYTRPTAFDWYQALSRRRKTLWSGRAPGSVLIDYNLPYLTYSRAVPNYDTSIELSPEAYQGGYSSELNYYNSRTLNGTREPQYCQSPSPVFVGNPTFCAEWWMRTGDAGGKPDVGLFPLWYIRYLYSMRNPKFSDKQKADFYSKFLLDNAEASATAPFHIRESAPGRFFDSARKVPAFGLPLSVNARQGIRLDQFTSTSGQNPEDALTAAGPVLSDYETPLSRGTGSNIQRWSVVESAHQPSFIYIPYLITGDWYYLEEQYFIGSFDTCLGNPTYSNDSNADVATRLYSNSIARHGNWGYLPAIMQARGVAWGLRSLGDAAILAPDGTPEKAYYTEIFNNNVQIHEGEVGIRDGVFRPADPACANFQPATSKDKWCWGRMIANAGQPNPLHIPTAGNSGLREGLDPGKALAGDSPWMQNFLYLALGHLEEAGLRQVSPWRKTIATFLLREIRDSAYNPYLVAEYRAPTLCSSGGSYCKSMKDMVEAFQWTAPLAADAPANAGQITIVGNTSGPGAPRMDEHFPITVQVDDEKIRLCNGSPGVKTSLLLVCPGGRGWEKTAIRPHAAGAALHRILDEFSKSSLDPDQGYAYFAYAASVYLESLTVNDSLTGQPITGESAIEWMWENLRNRERLSVDPKWAYKARKGIQVHATPGSTDARLTYLAPEAGACRIGLAEGHFTSSDDAADQTAAGEAGQREHTFTGLRPGASYAYRITCGTKAAVRALGSFQTTR